MNNVYQEGSNALFDIGTVGSIIFNNNTFIGVSNSILKINKFDLGRGLNSQISNIQISNSSATAITFGSFANPTSAIQTVLVENITYSSSVISTQVDLIGTKSVDPTISVNILMNNLKFEGINFANHGNLFSFKHKMALPTIISNSSFIDLTSSVVYADLIGVQIDQVQVQTKFVN